MRPVELGSAFQVGLGLAPNVGAAHTLIAPPPDSEALRAQNVTTEASGEKPSERTCGFTKSVSLPRVRLWNSLEPACVTHTSVCPSRSDKNATNRPSRETAAARSIPSKSVSN